MEVGLELELKAFHTLAGRALFSNGSRVPKSGQRWPDEIALSCDDPKPSTFKSSPALSVRERRAPEF